ncbi:MAG: glycosyltransferase family 4 protein [Actinomycetota bacterium]|nr:glycosyltransferase family 4 protein [Actinomycetota bacterium]
MSPNRVVVHAYVVRSMCRRSPENRQRGRGAVLTEARFEVKRRSMGDPPPTTLLDCRWLDPGGPGRATELLLRGLRERQPEGSWLLWGPPAVRTFQWPGAAWIRNDSAPVSMWGQRSVFRVPRAEVAVYMHQIRPLRPGRSITVVYDTAPIRHGGSRSIRLVKRSFLWAAVRLSSRIITISEWSKASIVSDLAVDPARIRVLRFPLDEEMATRVRELRRSAAPRNVALYVGRFARHKNLPRLIDAFASTEFRRRGGRLLLVGGHAHEVDALRAYARSRDLDSVDVEGAISQTELETLYATSRLVVLPSYEEGFGLPAWEAATCGLPVCVSTGGALPELFGDVAELFSPTSITEMADAIDRAAGRPVASGSLVQGPSLSEYASVFVEEVERVARGR